MYVYIFKKWEVKKKGLIKIKEDNKKEKRLKKNEVKKEKLMKEKKDFFIEKKIDVPLNDINSVKTLSKKFAQRSSINLELMRFELLEEASNPSDMINNIIFEPRKIINLEQVLQRIDSLTVKSNS
ncbi:hypothetical protein RFI_40216 [Reticulomyxa filosa]|uniref:Uncharacterized protein n=1 Tax=Reticulomyxa filosa TaxID=46433 RepID=X6L7I6_RETFI|nr:hypothetical protein RFI_40216 [Reticulomyxa filosa]|eukprot:ETN97315.1 hypothetical protein RFI_40216 [Reticulomyxa filosa]